MSDSTMSESLFEEIAVCDGRAIKISGASGVGKTSALARRVKAVLRSGVAPESIAVFVSTRNAAGEFSSKLRQSIGIPAEDISVGTLRDYCIELLLSPEAQKATGRHPRILADFEYKILLEDIKVLGIKPKRIREMLKFFFREWAEMGDEKDGFISTGEEELLYTTLRNLLIERKAMLIEEVPNVSYRALRDSGSVHILAARSHVFVDDYQNLDRTSQLILDSLASESLTIAGNENERLKPLEPFSAVEGFTHFAQSHPGVREFNLTESLRCSQSIAAAGNALILGSNPEQGSLASFKEDAPKGKVRVVKWTSSQDEFSQIALYLQNRIQDADDALTAKDVLVVVPNREWGRQFGRALRKLDIKTTAIITDRLLAGDPRTYARCQSLMFYTSLNLIAFSDDVTAWRNWCGYGDYLTRSNAWNKLEERARQTETPLLNVLEALGKDVESSFLGADELLARFREGSVLVKAHSHKNGFALLNALTPRGEELPKDILSLLEPIGGNETAAEFITRASQRLLEPQFRDGQRVRIGLPESIVGLTAPLVIMTGMVNGFVPSLETLGTRDDSKTNEQWQSDRRLFYSAFTKAETELIFSYFQKESQDVAESLGMEIHRIRVENGTPKAILARSSFLDEMGDGLPGIASEL